MVRFLCTPAQGVRLLPFLFKHFTFEPARLLGCLSKSCSWFSMKLCIHVYHTNFRLYSEPHIFTMLGLASMDAGVRGTFAAFPQGTTSLRTRFIFWRVSLLSRQPGQPFSGDVIFLDATSGWDGGDRQKKKSVPLGFEPGTAGTFPPFVFFAVSRSAPAPKPLCCSWETACPRTIPGLWGRGFREERKFDTTKDLRNRHATRSCTPSESLPRALSALCASIVVICEVLLGQKDKKRQFALVKSGMAVFNITIGLLQILLSPISLQVQLHIA